MAWPNGIPGVTSKFGYSLARYVQLPASSPPETIDPAMNSTEALFIFEDRWLLVGYDVTTPMWAFAMSTDSGASWNYYLDNSWSRPYWMRDGITFWNHDLYDGESSDDFVTWGATRTILENLEIGADPIEAHVIDPQRVLRQVVASDSASPFTLYYQHTADFGLTLLDEITIRVDASGQVLKNLLMTAKDSHVFALVRYGNAVDVMYSHDNGLTWGTVTTVIDASSAPVDAGLILTLTDDALYVGCLVNNVTYQEYRCTNWNGAGAISFSLHRTINAVDLALLGGGDDPGDTVLQHIYAAQLMLDADEPGLCLTGDTTTESGIWYVPESGSGGAIPGLYPSVYWPFVYVGETPLPPPPSPPVPVPPFRPHAGQHGISLSVFKPRITLAP